MCSIEITMLGTRSCLVSLLNRKCLTLMLLISHQTAKPNSFKSDITGENPSPVPPTHPPPPPKKKKTFLGSWEHALFVLAGLIGAIHVT